MEDSIKAVIMAVGMAILVVGFFLLFRAAVLWYWRVSEINNTLDAILAELKKISGKTGQLTQSEK
jgi:hypothetical protein